MALQALELVVPAAVEFESDPLVHLLDLTKTVTL